MRQMARQRRKAMTSAEVQNASRRIVERLGQLLQGKIALFWPMSVRNEVDLRSLCRELWAQGTAVALPYMEQQDDQSVEGFRWVIDETALRQSAHAFLQPGPESPLASELSWIVVPALLVTVRGERLGYGAGFYDRMLSRHAGRSVVVVYEDELVSTLPTEPHDTRVDCIVTPSRTLQVPRG